MDDSKYRARGEFKMVEVDSKVKAKTETRTTAVHRTRQGQGQQRGQGLTLGNDAGELVVHAALAQEALGQRHHRRHLAPLRMSMATDRRCAAAHEWRARHETLGGERRGCGGVGDARKLWGRALKKACSNEVYACGLPLPAMARRRRPSPQCQRD